MNLTEPGAVAIALVDADLNGVGVWTAVGTTDSVVFDEEPNDSISEEWSAAVTAIPIARFSFGMPVRMIRHPPLACLDTRHAIEEHLKRERISRLLAEARARPVVYSVPAQF
ncbi:hypothetical protein ACWDZ4_20590 [Streptomyces sp. NPDC003016]